MPAAEPRHEAPPGSVAGYGQPLLAAAAIRQFLQQGSALTCDSELFLLASVFHHSLPHALLRQCITQAEAQLFLQARRVDADSPSFAAPAGDSHRLELARLGG